MEDVNVEVNQPITDTLKLFAINFLNTAKYYTANVINNTAIEFNDCKKLLGEVKFDQSL